MNFPLRWHRTLAARFGVLFLSFVVVGSLLMLAWLGHEQQEESRRIFVSVARNDVEFVRRLNLPRSAQLAGDLTRLLRMDIYFRSEAGQIEPALPADLSGHLEGAAQVGGVRELPGGRQAVILNVDASHDMVFVRQAPAVMLTFSHPATRNALLAFWLLSAAFGWAVTRQLVRPVRRLTGALSGFFETTVVAPGSERGDEIGQLARALGEAREGLCRERRKREESERLALLGRMATGLAHEIKNPLASIQLHVQLAAQEQLDAATAQSLRFVRSEAEVIEGLVNQWLFLARPTPPKTTPVKPLEVIAETVAALDPQARHAGVTLVVEDGGSGDRVVEVAGDRARLQQALRNLLVNAIQALPGGGDVCVRVEAGEAGVVVAVEDSGAGFSEAALEHGAELFFSEREGGMGVGLNVVAEIISAHGGQMVLKNRPLGGARVELHLPRGRVPAESGGAG